MFTVLPNTAKMSHTKTPT